MTETKMSSTAKHGVACYIHQSLTPQQVSSPCQNCLSFLLPTYDLLVVVAYRPPSNSPEANHALIDAIVSTAIGHEVILMGDFNLPSLKWNLPPITSHYIPPSEQLFLDCFDSLGLLQWVSEPTYPQSSNVLDLFLTSDPDRVGQVKILPPIPKCDHCPFIVDYIFQGSFTSPSQASPHVAKARLWERGRYPIMNRELDSVDWDFEFAFQDVNACFQRFCAIVHSLVVALVPEKKPVERPPWRVRPPGSLIRRRSRHWHDYKAARSLHGRRSPITSQALSAFNAANADIHSFQVRSQANYESSLILRMKEKPKLFHAYIRHKKVGRTSAGPLRLTSGDSPQDMAESFSQAFSSVYTSHRLPNPAPFQTSLGTLTNITIQAEQVESLLNAIDPSTAMGPDGIHPHILKSCSSSLSYPLTIIFQKSLSEGRLPLLWKSSTIIPIHKKGSKYDPLNYRPLSMTSVPCKKLESLIVSELNAYLNQHSILTPHQFGFRAGHTTMDQLTIVYNEVTKHVDNGCIVDMVLFDFSKAFDVVSHDILLQKLSCLGISGRILQWLTDFLTGRTMCVEVGGAQSSPKPVLSGVPQGSVLGPILFLIYINNLASSLSSNYKIFADDLKMYCTIPHSSPQAYATASSVCQTDIDKLHAVGSSWGLSMNSSKCVVMRFHRRGVCSIPPQYSMNQSQLKTVSSHKDLGVVVDSDLKFHGHIRDVTHKAGGLAQNLLRSTVCRSPVFMITLFTTHVRPIIDYCSCVWNTGFIQDIRVLEGIQRRWTKHVSGLGDMDYGQRLKFLGLFSIQGRLLRADIIFYWKILTGRCSISPDGIFQLAPPCGTRGHPLKLAIPRCNTDVRKRSFAVRCIPEWNKLPHAVVMSSSLDVFKRNLTAHLGDKLVLYLD